ncbi:unnamed protein product, partial [Rotaria magnacalcarata]
TSSRIVSTERRDLNVRAQIAGHLCGIIHAGLAKLLDVLNLPSPAQNETDSKSDKQLLEFVKSTSEKSMARAVQDAVAAANMTGLTVSGDGFWQTRDFQSAHGAAAISSCTMAPQVLDIETCSKTCNDDGLVDSVADTDHEYHDTFCSTDGTSQTGHPSFDDDVRTSTDDHSTPSDE